MDTTIGNAIDVSSGKIGFSFIKVSFIISSLIPPDILLHKETPYNHYHSDRMAKNGYTRKIHTGFSFPNITESVLSVKFLPFQLMNQFLFGNITAYPFNQKPYVFYQNTQVTEERFCCK